MGGAVTRSRAGVATRLQQGASNEASVAVKDEAADTSSLLNGPIVKEEEDSLATRILSESSSKGKKRAVEVFQTDAAKRVKAESNTDGADVQVEQGVKTETTADADQFTSSATPARGYRGGGRKTTTKGKGKAKETKAEKEEAESTTAEAANKPKPKTIKAKGKASNASAKAEDSKYGPAVPGRATTSKSAPKKEATKAEVTTPPLPPEKREAVYRPAPSQSVSGSSIGAAELQPHSLNLAVEHSDDIMSRFWIASPAS